MGPRRIRLHIAVTIGAAVVDVDMDRDLLAREQLLKQREQTIEIGLEFFVHCAPPVLRYLPFAFWFSLRFTAL